MPTLRDTLDRFAGRFALALRRATRLDPGAPLDAPPAPDDALVRASTRHLPGAAWTIGLLSAFVFALIALLLRGSEGASAVAAVMAAIAAALLTGAAQESAFFRFADSLAPRGSGTSGHGVIALVLLLALRLASVAALGSVSAGGVLAALFAGPVVSRFAALLAAHWLDHGSEVDRATLRVAALWCVPPLLVMGFAAGLAFVLVALLVLAIAWVAMLRFFRLRPGAFDELRLASLQQVCEAAFYLGSVVGA